jgi:DNA-binding NarL/FixJ family response regulator
MRIIVAGSAAERARLRAQLDGTGIEIVGEFASLAAAQRAAAEADAILLAPSALHGDEEADADIVESLTSRETEVLELLAEGLPNKAIAGRLGISDQTVKFHVASISGKLGAANRTDAVRRAVRRGLIAL